jgi:hypothetical protein
MAMQTRILMILPCLTAVSCLYSPMTLERRPAAPTGLSGGAGRKVVLAVPFERARTTERCGVKKGGLNNEGASILCPVPPEQWLAEELMSGLRSAGIDVSGEPRSSSLSDLQIEGKLSLFFVEPVFPPVSAFRSPYFSNEADIEVELVARTATGLEARRKFYVKQADRLLMVRDRMANQTLGTAIDRIVRDMVAAILNLLNEFPEVGARDASPQQVEGSV